MTTFRLATINAHSFQSDLTYRNNVHDLSRVLLPLNLDLIAVQEAHNDENWTTFCQNLSLKYSIFDPTMGNFHGNGIASRYPLLSYSKQKSTSCPGEVRSLLQCRLDADHSFISDRTFAATHLDSLDEDCRLKQIKEFDPLKNNIDILMGDMNALTRDDYSDDYYKHIVEGRRKDSNWEKPRFDFTKLIRDEWGYQDAFKLMNPQLKDEQLATCGYGTRIGYIYVHPRMNQQWTLTKCQIIDTERATDHKAIYAEFELV